MTAITRDGIAKLYVATFNRAADSDGLNYWDGTGNIDGLVTSFTSMEEVASAFLTSAEAGVDLSEDRAAVVAALYENVLGREGNDSEINYWTNVSLTPTNELVLAFTQGALGPDNDYLNNKAEVASAFADAGLTDVAQAYSIMNAITADDATVTAAIASINEAAGIVAPVTDDTHYLTNGQDILVGNAGNDTFIARGNSSLDNADIIDGGDGMDTVEVMIDNQETAESPLFTNIEILKVQGQADTPDSGDNDVNGGRTESGIEATIDAGDMTNQLHGSANVGVSQYWSEDSRSDVVIEDIRRDSDQTTIGLRSSDAGDVDYGVYFSPDYIVAPDGTDVGGSLTINVADLQLLDDGGSLATNLTDFPYSTLGFDFDGVSYVITFDTSLVTNHASYALAMNNALTTATSEGVVVDLSDTLAIAVDGTFNSTSKIGTVFTGIPSIVITKANNSITGAFDQDSAGWILNSIIPGDTNYASDVLDAPTVELNALTQTDLILDYVGRGSKSGDVEIGNMSDGSTHEGSNGIEQFNVDVDRNSWIDALQSTDNALEVVNVENIGANGSLRIDELIDVRVFDAAIRADGYAAELTGMTGDVTLTANLTSAVVDKYLARQDSAADASADNSDNAYNLVDDAQFSYDFGSGDDMLSLTIDETNLQHAGSVTHEDFVLEVNGFDGNDELLVNISSADGDTTAWYENQQIVGGLTINGGAGNDVIRTGDQAAPTASGSGNFIVDGGTGSDVVYLDNTGFDTDWNGSFLDDDKDQNNGNAVWVLNSVDVDIDDLESNAANNTVSTVNMAVAVSFKGFEVVVDIDETIGSLVNVAVSDLRINQAIKEAINSDPVLSTLISAEDGPGRTLTIQSLIDGEMAGTDLSIDLVASTTALTAAQVTAGVSAYTVATGTLDNVYVGNPAFAQSGSTDLDGSDSAATSDNTVNGGVSDNMNDVLVLGTGADSNDTIVYTGTNTGTNFVVNFENTTSVVSDVLANIATVGAITQGAAAIPAGVTPAVAESFELKVSAATATGTLTFTNVGGFGTAGADTTVAVTAGDSADTIAAAIVTAGTFGLYTATIDPTDPTIVIMTETTPGTGGNLADVVVADVSVAATGVVVTVENTIDGVAESAAVGIATESFLVTFGVPTIDGDIAFDGDSIPVLMNDTAVDVAASIAAGTYTNWTAALTANPGEVAFTAIAAGAVTDVVDADFVGANIVTGVTTVLDAADTDMIDFSAYAVEGVFVGAALIEGSDTVAAGEQYIQLTESVTNAGEYLIELMSDDAVVGNSAADTVVSVIGTIDFGETQAFTADTFLI